MKKIFTLLFSLGILSSVFAQSQYAYSKSPIPVHSIVITTGFSTFRFVEAYSFSRYERDIQVAQINQKYNGLLRNIVNMRYLSAAQKVKMIREVEQGRSTRINAVHARFRDSRNKFNDWYYDKNFNRIR